VVIWLEHAAFLSFIHQFSNSFVEFVMFLSISDIQPRRVSWGDNSYTPSLLTNLENALERDRRFTTKKENS